MSKSKVIGVDIDGVLADFNGSYQELIIDQTGRDLFLPKPYQPHCWQYPRAVGYTIEEEDTAWETIKDSTTFWQKLNPLPGAREFIHGLEGQTDTLYFITSRVGKHVKWQTEDWLQHWAYDHPTVLISSEKGECCHALKVDYYLDDKDENCEDVWTKSAHTKGYMLAQPWNSTWQHPGVPRLDTLSEFLTIIKGEK